MKIYLISLLTLIFIHKADAQNEFTSHIESLNIQRQQGTLALQRQRAQQQQQNLVHATQNRLVQSCISPEHYAHYDRRTLTLTDSDGCLVMISRRGTKKSCYNSRRCSTISNKDAASLLEKAILGSNADIKNCLNLFNTMGYPLTVKPQRLTAPYDPAISPAISETLQ